MNNRIIKMMAAAVVTALVPIYGVLAADTYINDFEDENISGWSVSGNTMTVTDSDSVQGNAVCVTGSAKNLLRFNFDSVHTEDTVVISYAIKPMFKVNRYYNIVGLQGDGTTDYSATVLRHKNDGGFFYDPDGDGTADKWFSNMGMGTWNYISLLINNKEHTARIAYVRSNGSLERDDAVRMTGKFSSKITNGIKGFTISCDALSGGDTYWIDDFIVTDINSDDRVSPVKTNINGKAEPENKTVSLKYPVCFVGKNYATKDKVKITAVKNGVSTEIEDFDVAMLPNNMDINFDDELIPNAEYTVSFDDSVTNAFGQKLADYTFKTGAKQGTCLVEQVSYFDADGEVSSDAVPENISKIQIRYENSMVSGFDLVKIDSAEYESSYDANSKTQTLTFKKALLPFKDYELIIPSDVTDENGNTLEAENRKFSTVRGKFDITYDITGGGKAVNSLNQLSAGDTLDVKATLKGMENQTTDGYLWVGFYGENGELKSIPYCSYKKFSDTVSFSNTVPEGTKEIRINITDDRLRPLGKKCVITGGGISE